MLQPVLNHHLHPNKGEKILRDFGMYGLKNLDKEEFNK
jgi:hypothetical protein